MTTKHWFLPDNPDLLAMLRDQAAITVEAMDALVAWSNGDAAAARTVRECEHRADTAKRQLWRTLREAFSPPLDAEDLYTLSADLDEVLNAAKDLVREMEVMDMQPDAATHEMVTFLADGVGHLAVAFRNSATTMTPPQPPTRRSRASAGWSTSTGPRCQRSSSHRPARSRRPPRGLPPAVPHRRPHPYCRRTRLVRRSKRGLTSRRRSRNPPSLVGLHDLGSPGRRIVVTVGIAEVHLPRVTGQLDTVSLYPVLDCLICVGDRSVRSEVNSHRGRATREIRWFHVILTRDRCRRHETGLDLESITGHAVIASERHPDRTSTFAFEVGGHLAQRPL